MRQPPRPCRFPKQRWVRRGLAGQTDTLQRERRRSETRRAGPGRGTRGAVPRHSAAGSPPPVTVEKKIRMPSQTSGLQSKTLSPKPRGHRLRARMEVGRDRGNTDEHRNAAVQHDSPVRWVPGGSRALLPCLRTDLARIPKRSLRKHTQQHRKNEGQPAGSAAPYGIKKTTTPSPRNTRLAAAFFAASPVRGCRRP